MGPRNSLAGERKEESPDSAGSAILVRGWTERSMAGNYESGRYWTMHGKVEIASDT